MELESDRRPRLQHPHERRRLLLLSRLRRSPFHQEIAVRGWRIAGSSLERALGRPIRDQVYGTRDTQATTIQALELVNGETLTHWLWRGARNMLGELPEEPPALVARQANAGRAAPAPFDVDISHSGKLYLIVQDSLSTAPDKAAPVWLGAELTGPSGVVPWSSLTAMIVPICGSTRCGNTGSAGEAKFGADLRYCR